MPPGPARVRGSVLFSVTFAPSKGNNNTARACGGGGALSDDDVDSDDDDEFNSAPADDACDDAYM